MSGSNSNLKLEEPTQQERAGGSRSPSPTKKTVIETRRAEQNRAAQRAFRQRKERYVKELEAKVNSMADWPSRMERLENENESLKRKISELLAQQEESNKKMFVKDPTPSFKSHNGDNCSRKNSKIISPPPPPSATTTSSSTSAPSTPTTNTTNTKVVTGEKGRVLDDLVSILRTRHRPPIPSHPPNQEI